MVSEKNGTFCIDKDCTKSHTGNKIVVQPGAVFICRSPNKAFIEPVINSSNWDFSLLEKWMDNACTLSEWVNRFQLMKIKFEEDSEEIITEESFKKEEEFKNKAMLLKSVKKRKAVSLPINQDIKWEPVEKIVKIEQDELQPDHIVQALACLDKCLINVAQNMASLQQALLTSEQEPDTYLCAHAL